MQSSGQQALLVLREPLTRRQRVAKVCRGWSTAFDCAQCCARQLVLEQWHVRAAKVATSAECRGA